MIKGFGGFDKLKEKLMGKDDKGNDSKFSDAKDKMKKNNGVDQAHNKKIIDKINDKKKPQNTSNFSDEEGLISPSIKFFISTITGILGILLFFWFSFSVQFFFDYAWRIALKKSADTQYQNLLEIAFPYEPEKYPYVFSRHNQTYYEDCFICEKPDNGHNPLPCCDKDCPFENRGYTGISTYVFNLLYEYKAGCPGWPYQNCPIPSCTYLFTEWVKLAFISGYAKSHLLYNDFMYNLFEGMGAAVSVTVAKNNLNNYNVLFIFNLLLVLFLAVGTFIWFSYGTYVLSIVYTLLNLNIFSCFLIIKILIFGIWLIFPAFMIFDNLLAGWRTLCLIVKLTIFPTVIYGANIPSYFLKHKLFIGAILLIYFISRSIVYVGDT